MAGRRYKRADTWASTAPVSPEQILRDSRGPHDENSDDWQMKQLAQRSRAYTEGEGNPRVKNTAASDFVYQYQSDDFLEASWKAMASTFTQAQADNLELYRKAMHHDSEASSSESQESTFGVLLESDLTKSHADTSVSEKYQETRAESAEDQSFESSRKESGIWERDGCTERDINTLVSLHNSEISAKKALIDQQEASALDALAEVLGQGTEEENATWLDRHDGATFMDLANYTDESSASSVDDHAHEDKGIEYEEFISKSRVLAENSTDSTAVNLSTYTYNPSPLQNESVRSIVDGNNAFIITEREVDNSHSDSSHQEDEHIGSFSVTPAKGSVTQVEHATEFGFSHRKNNANVPESSCIGGVGNPDEATWLRRPSSNISGGSLLRHDSGSIFYKDDSCWPPLPKVVSHLDHLEQSKLESPKFVGKSKIKFKHPIDDRVKNDDKNDDKNASQKFLDLERRLNFLIAAQRSRDDEDFENSQINHLADSANSESIKRLERKIDNLLEKVAILYDLIPEIKSDIVDYHMAAYDMRKEATSQQQDLISVLLFQAQESELERNMDSCDWFEQVLWPQGDPDLNAKEDRNPSYRCTIM